MSAKATDVQEILRHAKKQGFTHMWASNGHIDVFTPDHIKETPSGRRQTQIGGTPGSAAAVRGIIAQLKGIGYQARVAPKPKAKNRDKPKKTNRKDEAVPRFGELVRVTGSADAAPPELKGKKRDVIPAREILEDVQLASWLVWDFIHADLLASKSGGKSRQLQGGYAGFEWKGSRNGVIRQLWPELPPPDYSVTPTKMSDEMRAIARYLTSSKNMAVLHPGDAKQTTTWWISAQWREVDPNRLTDLPSNWWERKVTPEEAGETRDPQPVTVTHQTATRPPKINGIPVYYCQDCSYRSVSAAGVSTHRGRLKVFHKAHPQGRYECFMPECLEVRGDPESLANHVSRDHHGSGLLVCKLCGQPYQGRVALLKHRSAAHPEEYAAGVEAGTQRREERRLERIKEQQSAPVPVPVLLEPDPEPEQTVASAPVLTPVTDPADYLRALIRDNELMRDQLLGLPGLQARVAELEAENAELRTRYERVSTWLQAYPFLKEQT